MSQTILIENNSDLNQLFSLNLRSQIGTEVIQRENAEEAISLLGILPDVDLIITRNKVGDEKTAEALYRYLQDELKRPIPMIILGHNIILQNTAVTLKDPIKLDSILKHATDILGVTSESVIEQNSSRYVPVPINHFFEMQDCPFSLYNRLFKSASEYEFREVHNFAETLNVETINQLTENGVKDLFIDAKDQDSFVTFFSNHIEKRLEEKNLSIEERVFATAQSFDMSLNMIREEGLTDKAVDLAKLSINSIIDTTKAAPRFESLLDFFEENDFSFEFKRCHLLPILSQLIMEKQNWKEEEYLEQTVYAAFFSDIYLNGPEEFQIATEDSLESVPSLEYADQVRIYHHACEAAKIMQYFPGTPEDAVRIVLQHHGSWEGIGMTWPPEEDLMLLSQAFMVSDNYLRRLFAPDSSMDKQSVITELYELFTSPSYACLVSFLEEKLND